MLTKCKTSVSKPSRLRTTGTTTTHQTYPIIARVMLALNKKCASNTLLVVIGGLARGVTNDTAATAANLLIIAPGNTAPQYGRHIVGGNIGVLVLG